MNFQPLVRAVPAPEKLKSSWSLRFQNRSSETKVAKKWLVDPRCKTSVTGTDGRTLSNKTSTGMSEMEGIGTGEQRGELELRLILSGCKCVTSRVVCRCFQAAHDQYGRAWRYVASQSV